MEYNALTGTCLVEYKDVKRRYQQQFKAAYEKSNIWPISNADDGMQILEEEICEVQEAAIALGKAWSENINKADVPDKKELGDLRGMAVSTILECLQVISVCDKYQKVFTFENVKQKSEE